MWYPRQVVLRDHISGLHEAADGRAYRIAGAVYLHSRFIKGRIKSRHCPARFQRGKIQLVTQTKFQHQLPRKLPIILEEQAVVSCAQDACANAVSVYRVASQAEQKIVEALEGDRAAPVIIRREAVPVKDDLAAGPNAVPAASDRKNIDQRRRRFDVLCIYIGSRIPNSHRVRSGWSDTDNGQSWIRIGVRSLDAKLRVAHRVLP